MSPFTQQPDLQIEAGAALFLELKAGSSVTSSTGSLRLAGPPRWLGERVVCTKRTLVSGERHTLADSGWVTLTAGHGGSTVCITQAPSATLLSGMPGRLWTALAVIAGRLRSARTA
ncbi:MAG: hypothetical protein V4614_08485 [Pseudomonadota bacterium]